MNLYPLSLIVMAALIYSTTALGQTVPSELLDMSIEELFQTKVLSEAQTSGPQNRWSLSYSFQHASFQDYFQGTEKTDARDLLWTPGQGPRGTEDYLAVTPSISQEVHAITLGFRYSAQTLIQVQVPWIKQETDHIAVIPNWPVFTVKSKDIGDVRLSINQQLSYDKNSVWTGHWGISLPTGSIEERADTPQGPDKVLPYTMQMGSGTWDLHGGIAYKQEREQFHWGADSQLLVRTGRNDRDYRLGNRATLNIWLHSVRWSWFQPGLQLSAHYSEAITGRDPTLPQADDQGRYPTAVLNPDNYGGKQVDATAFLRVQPPGKPWYVDARYTQPLYQNLNGPQVGLDDSFGLSVGLEL